MPQWSPVMKTGNTRFGYRCSWTELRAPQWSPVMKTGNTTRRHGILPRQLHASMEPGHEDREYELGWGSSGLR